MGVEARSIGGYQVEITAGRHRWVADEPVAAGGEDAGPNPYDLLLGALAACKLITVQMYAQRKGWPLAGVEIKLSRHKIHARDCEDCESDPEAKVDIIESELSFQGDLTSEQIERMAQIADRCPVHRTLTSETKIRSNTVD
jgi:putative redox protein